MPGAGKTTVGEQLAALRGVPFADCDREIEAAAGMTVAEIFARRGESHFRQWEAETIARLAGQREGVIAPGAGALQNDATFDLVRRRGVLVYLRAAIPLLRLRIGNPAGRPLLRDYPSPHELDARLAELLATRKTRYEAAEVTIEILDAMTPRQVAEDIERRLHAR